MENAGGTQKEIVFFNVNGIHLNWKKKSFFSYLSTPRPDHGLLYAECERVFIEYADGGCDVFEKGDLLYLPRGLRYIARFGGDTEPLCCLLVNFSVQSDTSAGNRALRIARGTTAKYKESLLALIRHCTQNRNGQYAMMSEFYALLDALVCREHKNESSIAAATDYIDSHICEKITVATLAKACAMCESGFRARFKAETGVTPTEYICELKLAKAAHILRTTDFPIRSVAAEFGFYDSSYFCKLFAKKYGASPAKYRKN